MTAPPLGTPANAVNSAKDNGFMLSLVKVYLPIAAGVLAALVCLFGGILLMRRKDAAAATESSFEDGLAEPRHGLREDHATM
jgi:hypothetical protein